MLMRRANLTLEHETRPWACVFQSRSDSREALNRSCRPRLSAVHPHTNRTAAGGTSTTRLQMAVPPPRLQTTAARRPTGLSEERLRELIPSPTTTRAPLLSPERSTQTDPAGVGGQPMLSFPMATSGSKDALPPLRRPPPKAAARPMRSAHLPPHLGQAPSQMGLGAVPVVVSGKRPQGRLSRDLDEAMESRASSASSRSRSRRVSFDLGDADRGAQMGNVLTFIPAAS